MKDVEGAQRDSACLAELLRLLPSTSSDARLITALQSTTYACCCSHKICGRSSHRARRSERPRLACSRSALASSTSVLAPFSDAYLTHSRCPRSRRQSSCGSSAHQSILAEPRGSNSSVARLGQITGRESWSASLCFHFYIIPMSLIPAPFED